MNDLVRHLTTGDHPIVASGPISVTELKRRVLDMRYVYLTFTNTKGDTELGIRLDSDATDVSQANFEEGTGRVHIEGVVTLDYVPIRCTADIDLATLSGTGRVAVRTKDEPGP